MRNLKDYKTAILGDSIAKGIIFQDDKIIKLKENAVSIIETHYDIQIDNQSYFGQTLKKLCEKNFVERYISKINPNDKNVMVLSIGGNDSDYDWAMVGQDPKTEEAQHTKIAEFSILLQQTITKLKEANVSVILTTLVPLDATRFFENRILKLAPMQNTLAFLHQDLSNIYRMQECFSNDIVRLALKNNCQLLDIRSQFLLQRSLPAILCEDGIHPNKQGQELIANTIINKLDEEIINL